MGKAKSSQSLRNSYMDWKAFDNNHRYQKKVILMVSGTIIFSLLVILLLMNINRTYFVIKVAPKINSELLQEDICYLAFDSISKKVSNPLVIDADYLKSMEDEKFAFIDYAISKESYRIIKKDGDNKCRIVINTQNQKGHNLRSFTVEIAKDDSYQFGYKVVNIFETMLEEKDIGGGV